MQRLAAAARSFTWRGASAAAASAPRRGLGAAAAGAGAVSGEKGRPADISNLRRPLGPLCGAWGIGGAVASRPAGPEGGQRTDGAAGCEASERGLAVLTFGALGTAVASAASAASPASCEERSPPPVVMAGPSGVGKGTIINELMRRYPGSFGFSVSHTTRAPRPGEVDGKHYHFVTKEKMQSEIEEGKFIEFAHVHGKFYGTSKAAVEAVAKEGKICILDIDVQGVQKVKAANLGPPKPRYVFVMPPGSDASSGSSASMLSTLEQRLRGRGTESEEKIQLRLHNAKAEIDYAIQEDGANFDVLVVNDDLELTILYLGKVIETWTGKPLK